MEDKGKKIFDYELIKRFVSDYKLPIPLHMDDYETFAYYLDLYEGDFGARRKWNRLVDYIVAIFEGDPKKFVADYYKRREDVIQYFSSNPALDEFRKMDMNKFVIQARRPKCSSKGVYNNEGNGKKFLSIDLRKANFQALHYINPAIVKNKDSYEEFIEQFAPGNEYFIKSKYVRQVIFGQAVPSRQVTVESYMLLLVWEYWKNTVPEKYQNIVSFSTDEFILRLDVDYAELPTQNYLDQLVEEVKDKLGITIHYELYTLETWQLRPVSPRRKTQTFFKKISLLPLEDKEELVCIPQTYRAIATKLLNDQEVTDTDRLFDYESYQVMLRDEFVLVKGVK